MKQKILKTMGGVLLITLLFFSGFSRVNAASASISVKSSASTVVVGKTFNVTVTVSSAAALGSWEFTIDYNSSVLQLQSGTSYIVDYGNGSLKSKSYNYSFKAIGTGSPKVSVKSYGAYDWSETKMSVSAGSATINVKTQQQIEAEYSKNNNLKGLSVEGYAISPEFNKDTLEYSVELASNIESIIVYASAEDSKSSVNGAGTIAVSEGENKISIVVTAENGSTKTYTLTAIVKDPNPVTVVTSTGETRTVVKRESLLVKPETFTNTSIVINEVEVPAFYSEITKYTLVGLKNEAGAIDLFVYDSEKNSFTLYKEVTFNQIKFYPLNIESDKFANYKLSKITLNDLEVNAYKIKNNSEFAIIYGINIETGVKDYYVYDSKDNTITRYNFEETNILNQKIKNYFALIIGLGVESLFLLTIIIIILINASRKKNKKKNKLEEIFEKDIKEIKDKKNKKEKKDKSVKLDDF